MKVKIIVAFLTSLLFASMTTVKAQGKCKFNAEGTDPITGIPFKSVGAYFQRPNTLILLMNSWFVNIVRKGDSYIIASQCEVEGIFKDKMLIGDTLFLKLENDKILKLTATKIFEPLHHSESSVNLVRFRSDYDIKIEDVQLLASTKVVFARIILGPKTVTEDVKEKDGIILQKGAICILK
jgi:hypothetical protein